MSDWDRQLSPDEQRQWDRWVRHVREDTVKKMADSAFVMSLVPDGEPDIKFAVELGLSIMLDKPIVAIALQGRGVPDGLRRVAHAVIDLNGDIDTEAGRLELQRKLDPILAELTS